MYLYQIVKWQQPSGCFGDVETHNDAEDALDLKDLLQGYHEDGKIQNRDNIVDAEQKIKSIRNGVINMSQLTQMKNQNQITHFRTSRHLLVEKEMGGKLVLLFFAK